MITFAGETIKCGNLHSSLQLSGGEPQRRETYFWGTKGVSEIVATTGAYDAMCTCWLNDTSFSDPGGIEKLRQYEQELRDLRGEHGSLIVRTSDNQIVYEFVAATFLGFEPTSFDGQRHPSPLKDDANVVNGGWLYQGDLRWRLLRGN